MSPSRSHPPAGVLFAALLAITLNLMQPLAHAAMMRDGQPGTLWASLCKTAAVDPEGADAPSEAGGQHDCCLGLAHAPSLAAPPEGFVLLPPTGAAILALLPQAQRPSVAIRDGPWRTRGPPSSPTT